MKKEITIPAYAGQTLDGFKWPWEYSLCYLCEHFHGPVLGTCDAFPDGIPQKFYFGDPVADHRQVEPGQGNSITFSERRRGLSDV